MALQIKRRIGTAGAPATLVAGQLAYNKPPAGSDALYIGDGTNVNPLVSDARQVELAGAQTITGAKTIAVANLHVLGGTNGQQLSTDGSGVLSWVTPTDPTVNVAAPVSGNGAVATPLGVTPATALQVTGGTDNVYPITSARLRDKLGAEVSTLNTTNKTVVPAINELLTAIEALAGPVRLVGTYDAAAHTVAATAGSGATSGALPAPSATNNGWVFVVNTSGTGAAPAPVVAMDPGDWILSNGTAWIHLDLNAPSTVAANVAVTAITGLVATNVQAALAEIIAGGIVGVAVNSATLSGDGKTATPLNVIGYDDGTY